MKAFISQPMRGRTDEEIMSTRRRAMLALRQSYGQDVQIIESVIADNVMPENFNPGLYYLGRSLQMMASADVVYFCKGWENARGCKIENICALEYGLTIALED